MTISERFEIRKQNNMVVNGKRVSGYVVVDNVSGKVLTKPMGIKQVTAYRDSMIQITPGGDKNENS